MPPSSNAQRVELLARLLALGSPSRPSARVCVVAIEDLPNGWRLELGGRELSGPAHVSITRAEAGEDYFTRTSELGLRFDGSEASRLVRQVLLHVARRLRRVRFDRLLATLGTSLQPADARASLGSDADPSTPTGALPAAGGGRRGGGPSFAGFPGLHQAWNHPDAWMHFFAEEELMPARDVTFSLAGESVRVEHGDFECQFVEARGFVAQPWGGRRRARGLGRARRPKHDGRASDSVWPPPSATKGPRAVRAPLRRIDSRERSLFTNLRELDAIDGGTERFEQLLTAIREHVGPDSLMVNCTCVPQIVGDDTEHVVARERQQCGYPIVYKDQRPEDRPHERGLAMMQEALRASRSVVHEPNVIHLVGFVGGPDRDELRDALAALDIEVAQMLVPEISPDQVEGFGRASLIVQFPNPDWLPFCDELFADLDVPRIVAPAPYGLAGTHDFLCAVVRGLGRDDLCDRVDRDAEQVRNDSWLALRARAEGERVGLIAEVGALERREGLRVLGACPIVPVLREMGFEVSLALVARYPESVAVRSVRDDWQARGAEVEVIESPCALDRWLARADVGPVYSDFFFDSRLVRTGHAPFSSRIFERGWPGALRTAQALLDRCHVGLLRRHHRLAL